ncbi:DUF4468 domain-containing protein [uncultured Chryseobacterium sp.]|uniref:DUF4468 domain-containing protein n=1 Tax=uncultured Chryseobacterium sp. TaxID=259322 RepID=UPI0025CBCC08|nr:DUF4468 domain-containing protein [uncultured Chryseobacterium sp.]
MRKNSILLFAFLAISVLANGQELEIVDGDYTYTKVIESNKTKSEIYSTLKKWLNNVAVKSKFVIDQDDPDTGILSFNEALPTMEYDFLTTARTSYKVNIEIKDKKVRYIVNNIVLNKEFKQISIPEIKQPYNSLLKDIEAENEKYTLNKNLMDQESKPRLKKKLETEFLNARNNLRSLNEINEMIKIQIISNENVIKEKINQSDDW